MRRIVVIASLLLVTLVLGTLLALPQGPEPNKSDPPLTTHATEPFHAELLLVDERRTLTATPSGQSPAVFRPSVHVPDEDSVTVWVTARPLGADQYEALELWVDHPGTPRPERVADIAQGTPIAVAIDGHADDPQQVRSAWSFEVRARGEPTVARLEVHLRAATLGVAAPLPAMLLREAGTWTEAGYQVEVAGRSSSASTQNLVQGTWHHVLGPVGQNATHVVITLRHEGPQPLAVVVEHTAGTYRFPSPSGSQPGLSFYVLPLEDGYHDAPGADYSQWRIRADATDSAGGGAGVWLETSTAHSDYEITVTSW